MRLPSLDPGNVSRLHLVQYLTNHLQRMEFYYMINYYFKYLELLDTVFLAYKKKPLGECARVLPES
jgi:hypothetical protein